MTLFKMAWRNVWRNPRRSGLTIAAMTLALVVELLYSGLVVGMISDMEDDAVQTDLGDLQIFADGYLMRPSLYEAVQGADEMVEQLEAAGYRATPRLYGGGLAGAGEVSSGVSLVGVDPVRDANTLALAGAIAEGAWLDDSAPGEVVIGRGLARTLGIGLGDEVVVLSQGTDGSVANDLYTVRGVLMSVAASMDRGAILMTESAFRELMVFPEGAHRILIRRPDGMPLSEAKAFVQAVAGVPAVLDPDSSERPANDVMTWSELQPMLAQWLQSVEGVVVVMYFIVYFAVGILILNAMLMAVFERIKELGVLKAIGYGPLQIVAMMAGEAMLQATVATGIGVLLAAPFMWYLQTHGIDVGVLGGVQMAGMTMPAVWHGRYSVDTASVPVVMLYFIAFGAVIYPALKAAWVRPVEAMHHQ